MRVKIFVFLGKGHLNLDADGISNVGRAHLELGMEGGINVPGISNSLVGKNNAALYSVLQLI